MDYDGDGENDMCGCCPDKPYDGTYFFESADGDKKMPVFKPSVPDAEHQSQNETGGPLRLNNGSAGKSGRRKFCFADWDLDGR